MTVPQDAGGSGEGGGGINPLLAGILPVHIPNPHGAQHKAYLAHAGDSQPVFSTTAVSHLCFLKLKKG